MADTIYYYSDNTTSASSDSVLTINSRNFNKILINVVIGDLVTDLGEQAFSTCTSLTNINIPNGIKTIGNSAFTNSSGLVNIIIPDSVTSIGNNAFQNCTGLQDIIFSKNLETIGFNAFTNCSSLKFLNIPSKVNSIGNRAFNACPNLTTVTIPSAITFIDDLTFYNDTSLTRINFLGNAPTLGSNVFLNTNINLKIYRYSTKSGWSNTFEGKNVLLIDSDIHKGLQTFGFGISSAGKISIKKQNLTKLKPYYINNNELYDSDALYVFKGGTTNTISTVFNYLELKSTTLFASSDYIAFYNLDTLATITRYWYRRDFGWRTNSDINTNAGDNIILPNTGIYFVLDESTYKEISVGGDAIIQKVSGGKLSLKSSAIPLNILNIRVNNGPTNSPWGVGGSGPCGNDFQLLNNQNGIWSQSNLGCDFFIAWDNQYGNLPYKWRMYYDSDGRNDYAFHPTAGPEALPSKGWSNGMTITAI